MAPVTRLFPGDAEAAKRDDDHVPGSSSSIRLAWQHRRRLIRRPRWQRVLLFLGLLVAIYYFIKNIPTDLRPPRQRPSYSDQSHSLSHVNHAQVADNGDKMNDNAHSDNSPHVVPIGKPKQQVSQKGGSHVDDGLAKLDALERTLRRGFHRWSGRAHEQNVVFAASRPRSASNLLLSACDMGVKTQNAIHFVYMGDDQISLLELRELNGITDECHIIFHDAQFENATAYIDNVAASGVAAALKIVGIFLRPQAVLIDSSGADDTRFIREIQVQASDMDLSVIALPQHTGTELAWITRLDSQALKAWSKTGIEIYIHVKSAHLGSLERLLDSLKRADYTTMMIPRLTIDLPAVLDHLTIEYLDAFKWPPGRGVNDPSLLKLQHRSARSRSNSVEDSIRLVESVWIGEPAKTHVLVLSAHVEVSPYFMHYLKYNILSQKHIVKDRERHSRLMGLALDSPSIHLNGSLFSLPTSIEKDNGFLWQAPSRHAALYFGDFWKELQSFVGRSVALQVLDNYRTPSQDLDPWQDYVLQLAKLRGYFMLYPHFLPEIIKRERVVRSAQGHLQYDERSAIVAESQRLGLPSQRYPLLATSLHQLIDLSQSIEELPLLSWDGHEAWIDMLRQAGDVFRTALKHEISCERAEAVLEHQADVEDLFCGA